jgi:hypothetical protein
MGNSNITDNGLQYLSYLSNLRQLNLTDCYNITDKQPLKSSCLRFDKKDKYCKLLSVILRIIGFTRIIYRLLLFIIFNLLFRYFLGILNDFKWEKRGRFKNIDFCIN